MSTSEEHLVVALLADERSVVAAAKRLQELGIENRQISVLTLNPTEAKHASRLIEGEEGALRGESLAVVAEDSIPTGRNELRGLAVGSGIGVLLGVGLLAVPGLGVGILAAGPVVVALSLLGQGTIGGVGMGMLLGAIFGEVDTEAQRKFYADQLEKGDWMLVVHGDEACIAKASVSLQASGAEQVDRH